MSNEMNLADKVEEELSDEVMENVSGGVRMYFCVIDDQGRKQYMSRMQSAAEKYAAEHGGTVRRISI